MKKLKSQSSIDFIIAYSVSLAIIIVVLAVIFKINIFGINIAPTSCISSPSFSCGGILFNSNGLITFTLSQATGAAINITGVACSSAINSTSYAPEYGNIYVLNYKQAPQYYPNNELANAIVLYSDSSQSFQAFCYDGSSIAKINIGNTFAGFIWINYTTSALPKNYYIIEKVMSFSTDAG
ncbi:MAG: hypothetical protein M1538_03880 [Candidatus Marsarchaeota archaeon]|jgi:hypothetical protein|nr:hypothetical protein [Candidatus Marsarchaeota archaeon]